MEPQSIGEFMKSGSGNVMARLRDLNGQLERLTEEDRAFVLEVQKVAPFTALSRDQIVRIMDMRVP